MAGYSREFRQLVAMVAQADDLGHGYAPRPHLKILAKWFSTATLPDAHASDQTENATRTMDWTLGMLGVVWWLAG